MDVSDANFAKYATNEPKLKKQKLSQNKPLRVRKKKTKSFKDKIGLTQSFEDDENGSNDDDDIDEEELNNDIDENESHDDDDENDPHDLCESEDSADEDAVTDPYIAHFQYILPEETLEGLEDVTTTLKLPGLGNVAHHHKKTFSPSHPNINRCTITDFHFKKNLLATLQSSKEPTPMQLAFMNLLLGYYDVLYTRRTHSIGAKLLQVYTLHILNHILKSRAKIIHHNSKLTKNPDEEFRDQGFTRPLAVVLVPFRNDCFKVVMHLISLLPDCVVTNKKRFEEEYGPPPPSARSKGKPDDFSEIFEGNIDEDFKIGIRIKNKSMTLYSKFYASDLIIASPLGLRQIIGAEGDKLQDFDFLSSVEILVIDRAEILLLQNLPHFAHVLRHFNLLPKETRGCNFFRVREYALDSKAKFFRQTILLSSVEHMLFEGLVFRPLCSNYKGYVKTCDDAKEPAISSIHVDLKMCFRWFETESPLKDADDRFNFFVNKVLPEFRDDAMTQTLIYIPSYFDYARLRNHFRENEISAVMVCEYSKKGKIAQARDVFFKGYRHFMLYTERAHFYRRYRIKGIQHLIFYQAPMYPHFFRELCNHLLDGHPKRKFEERSCTVLASPFDALQIKALVGLRETLRMRDSEQNIFVKYIDTA